MPFDPAYAPAPRFETLGADFADPVEPAGFPKASPRYWNNRWADAVGLGALTPEERAAHFHRFDPLPDNQAERLAVRYHGHQFRTYNPEIGDGRGFLHAQLRDGEGRLLDFGTKGSGRTPYSRTGDGRLTLKGAVREILATEMLEALGVYTSKTFSVFETGEPLHRHDEPSPTRSAVLTRLQHSHVRFGMFQRHAFFEHAELVKQLLDYAVAEYHPKAADEPGDLAGAFLARVAQASARLAAEWMAAGFVHGVLNTDNLVVTGESFDYGPWRFLPVFEPGFTAAYFDQTGLYAYARQPESVFWALQQLAGALSLAGDQAALVGALQTFPDLYKQEVRTAFMRRLGVAPGDPDSDGALVTDLLNAMKALDIPFEAVFFDWFGGPASRQRALEGPRAALYKDDEFASVAAALSERTPVRPERLEHPYFSREAPLAMTIEIVEGLWAPIAESDDWGVYEAALADIAQAREAYALGEGRPGFLPPAAPAA